MAAPAVVLLGGFVAYQALPQRPDPLANNAAAIHLHALPLAGGQGGKTTADNGKSRHGVNARSADRLRGAAKGPVKPPAAAPRATPHVTHAAVRPKSAASSAASLNAAVHRDIASGNDLLAVAQFLVEHGYSRAAAAGVASCVDGESGGNPESVGSGGGGLIGWTPLGSAAPNANIITGNPAQDMMTQLGDILYYNSSEIGQSLVNQLNAISSPVSAADFFSANFEKPAVMYSDVVPSVAEQVYTELGG